jgi:Fe-Mn family superoxide dismutase
MRGTMFNFQDLPYPSNALEPVLSQKAVDIHYGKHHRKYYDNLVSLVDNTSFAEMSLVDIIRKTENPIVFNNAAQVFNHDFYWKSLAPVGEKQTMPANLKQAIESGYNSADQFKETFIDKAAKHFGSGWIWLVRAEDDIELWTTHDADTPISKQHVTPLLCVDLWEHAFYLTYEHDKKLYLEKIYEIINWEFANNNLKESM